MYKKLIVDGKEKKLKEQDSSILAKIINLYFNADLNKTDLLLLTAILENYTDEVFTLDAAFKQKLVENTKYTITIFNNTTRKLIINQIIGKVSHRKYKLHFMLRDIKEAKEIQLIYTNQDAVDIQK